jgi:hypothetical protein
MPLVEYDNLVQELAAHTAAPALGDTVLGQAQSR